MSLNDINFESPRLAIYFHNISLGVVPQRDIIYFVSDLFLVVWRSIFSLAIYFWERNPVICCVLSPRGRPALLTTSVMANSITVHGP